MSRLWLERAEALLDAAAEELTRKMAEMTPEQLVAVISAVGQRVTTHRAVVAEPDGEPDGPTGDRGDRAPAKRRAKSSRPKSARSAARGRRAAAPAADAVDSEG
jgi:hypothetical protein